MTPKEKAENLLQLYLPYVQSSDYTEEIKNKCKQCALVAVEEIIKTLYEYHYDSESGAYEYWQEVKQEIEKL